MKDNLFVSTPQNRFYSYVSDGHIYSITTEEPDAIADGGGYWNCYFVTNPYYKMENKKLSKVYYKSNNNYIELTRNDYYTSGNQYYFFNCDEYKPITNFTEYYNASGSKKYNCPNSASELPQVTYTYDAGTVKARTVTYYFDTLIKNGDSYIVNSKNFKPMDTTVGSGETTYGDILLDIVKDNIHISNFENTVNEIPEFLKGKDISQEYKIASINYVVPANYLIVFGALFIEKLENEMVACGNKIITNYIDSENLTLYTNINLKKDITKGSNLKGTISIEPKQA